MTEVKHEKCSFCKNLSDYRLTIFLNGDIKIKYFCKLHAKTIKSGIYLYKVSSELDLSHSREIPRDFEGINKPQKDYFDSFRISSEEIKETVSSDTVSEDTVSEDTVSEDIIIDLEKEMEEAIGKDDFSEASRIRDEIKKIKGKNNASKPIEND